MFVRPTPARGWAVAAATAMLVAGVSTAAGASELATGHAGRMSGLVPATASSHAKPSSSPNLTYHGGPVMTTPSSVKAIFWGGKWADSSFVSDKLTGIDSFYSGLSRTAYAGTNTEYTSADGHVTNTTGYTGHLVDTSPAPSRAPQTSDILAEVARQVSNPVANGYYPVYVDTPRGHAGYCAWHSYGTVNGVVVQFGFFFNLDGDPGCDPQDTSGAHSQGLAAIGNVSGHEWSEMVTDRHLDAWYDAQGSENSDKCAWTFGAQLVKLGSTSWKIQGNWSNNAYNARTGYVFGGSVVRGCVDGTN